MRQAFREKLERYRQYKEEHPGETQAFYAEHFDVDGSTISRWNDKLQELSIEDRIRAQLEKEFEARVQAVAGDLEVEREAAAAKKAEKERRKAENKREHFKRILRECPKVDIYPNATVDVTWQGFRHTLIGGVKNVIPEVVAGVYYESQRAQAEANRLIAQFVRGQHLGKV